MIYEQSNWHPISLAIDRGLKSAGACHTLADLKSEKANQVIREHFARQAAVFAIKSRMQMGV